MARKNFVREKRIYCGKEWLEVDITPVTNMPEDGKGKQDKTTVKQQNLNDKRSKRRFIQIANTNFGKGDIHLSATYDNEHLPGTIQEADRNIRNYLDRVKRKMKKETGQDLKAMIVTEYTLDEEGEDEVVRLHHHIILNGGLSRDDLELMWTRQRINWKKVKNDPEYRKSIKLMGFVNCDRIQPNENGIEGLVNYMNKRKKGCKKWSTTQNLEKPEIKKNDHKYSFRKLRELSKTPEDKEVWRKQYPGYEPTKIQFEYNEYTGWSVYLRLQKVRGYSADVANKKKMV